MPVHCVCVAAPAGQLPNAWPHNHKDTNKLWMGHAYETGSWQRLYTSISASKHSRLCAWTLSSSAGLILCLWQDGQLDENGSVTCGSPRSGMPSTLWRKGKEQRNLLWMACDPQVHFSFFSLSIPAWATVS